MSAIEQVKANVPDHLKQFIVDQNVTNYTPIDQAAWRFILRQLKNFLSVNAHRCYVEGLEKTGITVEEIPSIESICEKLQEFGWSAVPVSGFIPPAAFMEMQSLGILPIASDMRSADHILYTPAPDIVHEAAGHAPILVDPKFANYLKSYAAVAKKALISKEDLDQYEAIRVLSDTKENPESTPQDIKAAEDHLDKVNQSMKNISEAALLGRMNWWTAEYGLIGELSDPKIYGAGLLSSVGESKDCLNDHVKKIPLTVDCIDFTYDITEPQPQLFVANTFDDLGKVLEELADKLAFRRGGAYGLEKAIEAQTVNTVELNSGLQASGQVVEFLKDSSGRPTYFRMEGPTQLCVDECEIRGHGKDYHSHGYSTPLGKVKGFSSCLSQATYDDLMKLGLEEGKSGELEFESGIKLKGIFKGGYKTFKGLFALVTFEDCTVTHGERILFQPDWGVFDMAVGTDVVSVFAGPADRKSYGQTDSFAQKRVPPRNLTDEEQALNLHYESVRQWRRANNTNLEQLNEMYSQLKSNFPTDWLLPLELLEICHRKGWSTEPIVQTITKDLQQMAQANPTIHQVVNDGLKIADKVI